MDAQWFKRSFSDNSHQFIAASSKKESFSKLSLEDFLAEATKQHFFFDPR
jgi:23S rRNA (guanosine2251-2'-O)-methyltransferase